jgi:hypothetical protein
MARIDTCEPEASSTVVDNEHKYLDGSMWLCGLVEIGARR